MSGDLVSLTSGTEPIPSNLEHWGCSNAHRLWECGQLQMDCEETARRRLIKEQTIFPRSSQSTDVTLRSHYRLLDNVHTKLHVWHWLDTHGPGSTRQHSEPMINAILLKMGYSSKTGRHVVFRSRNYLGIGARQETYCSHQKRSTTSIRSDQDLSNLLHIGLEWFQLHAGIARPTLECPSTIDLPYLEVG